MTNKTEILLSERLMCASRYIRDGAILCDVGTDHGKLPIFLVQQGRIKKAYATDINKGPILCAKRNIDLLGLTKQIECIRTDGLDGIEMLYVSDISICGMGGELISRILSDATFIKDSGINLVLQPMTHIHDLRKFLWDNEFVIDDETLCMETNKLYLCIRSHYIGIKQDYEDYELYVGKILNSKNSQYYSEYISRLLYHFENRKKSNDISEAQQAGLLFDKIKEVMI